MSYKASGLRLLRLHKSQMLTNRLLRAARQFVRGGFRNRWVVGFVDLRAREGFGTAFMHHQWGAIWIVSLGLRVADGPVHQ
jgi:hypothetical protein